MLTLLAMVGMQATFAVVQARLIRSIDRLIDGMCGKELPPNRMLGEADQSL